MAGVNYLLDSNILSEPTRRHPDGEVRSRLQAYRHEICTAAPIDPCHPQHERSRPFRRPERRELVRAVMGDGRKGRRWLRERRPVVSHDPV